MCTHSTGKDKKLNQSNLPKYLNNKLIIKKYMRLADFKFTSVLGNTFFMNKSFSKESDCSFFAKA